MVLEDICKIGFIFHPQGGLFKDNYKLFKHSKNKYSLYNSLDCKLDSTEYLIYYGEINNINKLKKLIENIIKLEDT